MGLRLLPGDHVLGGSSIGWYEVGYFGGYLNKSPEGQSSNTIVRIIQVILNSHCPLHVEPYKLLSSAALSYLLSSGLNKSDSTFLAFVGACTCVLSPSSSRFLTVAVTPQYSFKKAARATSVGGFGIFCCMRYYADKAHSTY